MVDIKDEIRVFKKITWPLMKDNFNWPFFKYALVWEYRSMIPPPLQWWSMELELRREMNKEEAP